MKAIVQTEFGSADVLRFEEVDKPVVEDDEVLVRVLAAGVHAGDWLMVRGLPYIARPAFGLTKPKDTVPGTDLAGTVEAVGSNVTGFQPDDEVFGWGKGAFAEYASVSEDALALKPANVTHEQAATVPTSAFTALQALRDKGKTEPEQKVLIIGASGGVGTFAVQIAKSFGAEVTGVCSTPKVDMVRSLGADHVIDYTREDIAETGQRYDLILDTGGNRSLSHLRSALTPTGTLVIVGNTGGPWLNGIGRTFRASLLSPFVSQRMPFFISTRNKEDLVVLKELLETGKITPAMDRTYSLSDVPEAFRYFGDGHAKGKIAITVATAD